METMLSAAPAQPRSELEHAGAYGLRLTGLGSGAELLGDAVPGWPTLDLRWLERSTPFTPVTAGDDAVVDFADEFAVVHLSVGSIEIMRSPLDAVLRLEREPGIHELLHPYLGAIAAVAGRWLGRDSVHAGSFTFAGGTWGVLGGRNAGKSSLLAQLALDGVQIVGDDVLVVEKGQVFPAPRFVDLRADTAIRLGVGEELGQVGARERWRMPLPTDAPILPLRGWIRLGWAASTELRPVPPADRLLSLAPQLSIGAPPLRPESLIELAALPMFEFLRPRDWASLAQSCRILLDALAEL